MRTLKRIVLAAAAVAAATSAQAETNWDLPLAWPPGNLHVENAQAFADAVKEGTNGELVITLHPGGALGFKGPEMLRSEEHTSELQSLMRISYAVFCLKKKKQHTSISNSNAEIY